MAISLIFLLFVVAVAFLVARLIYNWTRLRSAPGPILAGTTDLWRAYWQYKGELRQKILDLHSQHNPIVRYGVRSISISDPEVINVVYGSRAGFITADSYKVLIGIANGKEVTSLVSTADEKRHEALHRSVANAFTPTAVLDYEDGINVTIADLLRTISKKTTFDLTSLILYYTMDAAGRFAFGEPFGCLAAEDDVGGAIAVIRERFAHWGKWSSLPQLERLVYRNPITMRQKGTPSSMAAAALGQLKAKTSRQMKDVEHVDLLERFLENSKGHKDVLDPTGIMGLVMSTISGAGDTTANTVTSTLYFLLKYPETLKKLEEELTQAHLDEIPDFASVSRLPYLNAVIREAMRVWSASTWPIERTVPAGGATIAGKFFPAGTSVGCLPAAVHQNVDIFGEDANVFRPERWLTPDRENLRQMEAAHMGFSRGRRSCLGQHIAVLQMKKLIPALLMKFRLSLADPDASLEADCSPAVASLKSLQVNIEVM